MLRQPATLFSFRKLLISHVAGRRHTCSIGARHESTPDKRRNIGIVAHINAGKTTTTERILYLVGSTNTVGDVDRGNTITDYLSQERERGITITSAAVTFNWKQHQCNLIDTPGHVDFTMEVERSLSVLDGVVTVLDASAGVEAQTITVWNQAIKYALPNIIFLNKYDKPAASYEMCLKDIKLNFDIDAALLQLPVVVDGRFSSIIDVVNNELITWDNPQLDCGKTYTTRSLSDLTDDQLEAKYLDRAAEAREKVINLLSDSSSDEFASHVIECDKLSQVSSAQLEAAIRAATINARFCPVIVGSSFKYVGVQQLLDSVNAYLPSPTERENQVLRLLNLDKKQSNSNCAFIFKIMHDKRLGALTYLRVLNGTISNLQRLKKLDNQKNEQVKKVYRVFADELKELDGGVLKDDIVVVTGITEAKTGDILIDPSFHREDDKSENLHESPIKSASDKQLPFSLLNQQILVPQISSIEPVYFCSIESRTSSQQLKLEHALSCLSREDPSFRFEIDSMGLTTISGMGKLHLAVVRDRIQTEYNIDPLLGPLQISYRETLKESALEEFSFDRLINGQKNSLFIKMQIRSAPGSGNWLPRKLKLDTRSSENIGKLRSDHRKAIEAGILSAMSHGPSRGYPVIDCEVVLVDFKANSRCGMPIIASSASQCLLAGMRRSSPIILEPIMLLEIVVPASYNGLVLGDLSARRSIIVSTTARVNSSIVVRAKTPLAMLADYSEFLRITTSGRGCFSMELFNYCEMSSADMQAIV